MLFRSDRIVEFLTDSLDVGVIFDYYDELEKAFIEKDKEKIKNFSLLMLENSKSLKSPKMKNIKKGLLKVNDFDIDEFDLQDMIALFYFSYSVVKR